MKLLKKTGKFLKKAGFTLAEMLIVMAVVVILAAAAIPAVGNQTEAAKQSNDLAILHDLYTQAYVEAAIDEATGTLNTESGYTKEATFQSGKFNKIANAKISNVDVHGLELGSGGKTVTFKFQAASGGGGGIELSATSGITAS